MLATFSFGKLNFDIFISCIQPSSAFNFGLKFIIGISQRQISIPKTIINIMITKITAQKLFLTTFNFFRLSNLSQQSKSVVSAVPVAQLPVRKKFQQQDRFSKQKFFQLNNYQRKDRPPQCRYYALEYKNRIYHVFNAYYYPMGRMVGQISKAIRGKNSPLYRNSQADVKNGDICVIVNAVDPLFTGKKLLYKKLRYHTGFVGHLKTFSYRHVLNTKPQLLYYYLLRKCMPKNKISEKYLANLKIYRGPTHDIGYLPQFAPDKNIYEFLPQSNLPEYIRTHPDIKIVSESQPGLAKQYYNRDFQYFNLSSQTNQTAQQSEEDTSKLHKKAPQYKETLSVSPKNLQKLRRKEKRILDRYRQVRAPYRIKQQKDDGFLFINDQRKARKMEEYKIVADQDLEEEDQQVVEDPYGRKARQAKEAAAKKQAKKDAKK